MPSFRQSGAVVHLINPIKSKAGGSWAAVQRRHSLLQCGRTVNLQLHLLQAVLVPALQYGCQIWGMHSPRVAAANHVWVCNAYMITTSGQVCGLLQTTPCKILLAELGLLHLLQGFWWRQTLQFWTSLAALPAGTYYHTVCLDNLDDAFREGGRVTWQMYQYMWQAL